MARSAHQQAGPASGVIRGGEPASATENATLKIEKLGEIWREIDVLARFEHDEMEKGFRPYRPDWQSMAANEIMGNFKCLAARKNGELIGYLCYSIDFDMEAVGVLIVHQLAWYVQPGHFSLAVRMFDWLVAECRRLGVEFLYLSHPERGRGKTLGRFFARRGAHHTGNTYTLKL